MSLGLILLLAFLYLDYSLKVEEEIHVVKTDFQEISISWNNYHNIERTRNTVAIVYASDSNDINDMIYLHN
jgi:hypothetical protein